MDIFDGIILGLVQGLSEFLPISSSGHLILAREALGLEVASGLALDATLHFVTAIAVIVYFHRDIWQLTVSAFRMCQRKTVPQIDTIYVYGIMLATIPAVGIGVLLESQIETVFRNANLVAGALVAGSLIMAAGEWVGKRIAPRSLSYNSAIAIGLFQTLALIPGMSRSGMAITGGLFAGLSRADAARFAFLIGVPLFLGAGGKKAIELTASGTGPELLLVVVSAIAAFASAIAAIHVLLRFLRHHSLYVFVGYRLILAVLVFMLL